MDIEKILQTNIPDLTLVYGGVRGRTLSSSHQAYAWKAMKEAGLKQVIDLRQDYKGDRYKETCEANGIAYYHYPVHKGKEPPVLVGYLKEKGHDAGKIFHVLNSFYNLYTEQNGVEPIPIELFKERKNVINRISKGEDINET